MLQAVLDAVAEQGYQDTRVTDIIARAGVSRKTFYEHFDEKEQCFLAAYDRELTQLTEEVAAAFLARGPGQWEERVRDGVHAFLRYLAERPAAARVCMVDAVGAGPRAIVKREAAIRNFTYLVDAGRSEAALEVPGRTAVAVLGGANELIAGELIHGSAKNVGTLAPDIVYLITLPFLGPAAALEQRDKARDEVGRWRLEVPRPASPAAVGDADAGGAAREGRGGSISTGTRRGSAGGRTRARKASDGRTSGR